MPAASGRYTFRPAGDAAEINALVARIAEPDVLTGKETARLVRGVDLATDPLAWLTGPPQDWRIALDAGEPVGLAAAAGDACYPLIAYLGLLDEAARGDLLAEAVGTRPPPAPGRWSPTWTPTGWRWSPSWNGPGSGIGPGSCSNRSDVPPLRDLWPCPPDGPARRIALGRDLIR